MASNTSLQQAWPARVLDRPMPLGFLATVFVANLLALTNFSVMVVAMVPIDAALGAPEHMTLQLPCAIFAAMVCAAPVTPYLLRRWGTRRLLLTSIIGLAVTTALAALCTNIWQLMLAMFFSGLASAPVVSSTQAAVDTHMPGPDRGIGMAVWGAGIYASGLIGPIVASYFLDAFGWRALFLAPLPLTLLTAALIMRNLKPEPVKLVPGDVATLVLAPLTILFLVNTCSLGRSLGWSQSYVPYATLAGLLIVAPLYAMIYRQTPAPALDLGCLRDRNVSLTLLLVFFVNLLGTGLFQVEFLGRYSHLSNYMLGLRTTIGTLGLLAGMALAAWLCHARRADFALLAGLVLSVFSKVGFLFYDSHTGAIAAIWPVVVGGVGFGLIMASLATIAYRSVKSERAPDVATLFVLATFLGACLGTGVLDEVLLGVTTFDLDEGMSLAAAKQAAFKAEFWVELLATLPLLLLARILARDGQQRTA